jgi:hypothetical protein
MIPRPNLPIGPDGAGKDTWSVLQRSLDRIVEAINGLSAGRLSSSLALASVPTEGSWARGDVVRNSAPAKVTGGDFNYVLLGWVCTVAGVPGTWEELRIPCA